MFPATFDSQFGSLGVPKMCYILVNALFLNRLFFTYCQHVHKVCSPQ